MKSNLLVGARLAGTIVVAIGANAPLSAQDSTMFRGDLAHSGAYAGPALRTLPGVKWSFHTDGYVISSPAVAGDAVFFGSTDSHLYRVDRATGAFNRKFKTDARIASSPAFAGGLV